MNIHCPRYRDIFIVVCYISSVSYKTFHNNLRYTLNKLNEKRPPSSFVVCGYFNYPGWDWAENCLKPNTQYSLLHHEFADTLDDFGLAQLVTATTRLNNTLDLMATNIPDQNSMKKVIPGISDHDIVVCELNVTLISRKQQRSIVWLFNKADWLGMAQHL